MRRAIRCAQWNYPIDMFSWKLGPAFACGCPIIFKPSELTPLTGARSLLYCTCSFSSCSSTN